MVLKSLLSFSIFLFAGCTKTAVQQPYVMSPTPSPLAADFEGQYLSEMFRVLEGDDFQKNPVLLREYSNLYNIAKQGASLEGIYNGWVHSTHWREKEGYSVKHSKPLSIKNRTYIVKWMFETYQSLINRSALTSDIGQPLQASVEISELSSPVKSKKIIIRDPGLDDFLIWFSKSPRNVLARVWCDWLLLKYDEIKLDSKVINQWYFSFVLKTLEYKTDYGISLRHNRSSEFHLNWLKTATEDKIKWEILNRVFRLTNTVE